MSSLAERWDELEREDVADQTVPITAPPIRLGSFVRQGWHVIEPDIPFIPNWHADAICEHLEWVAAGEILRLLISIAPGAAKSILVGVMWPAWMWTWRPGWRSIYGAYDQNLSTRDAVKSRDVMMSEWYQETFHPSWKFTVDQNVKSYYRNDARGERMAVSVDGKTTGLRGNLAAYDDPLNVKSRSLSDNDLDGAIHWWDKAMSNRLNNPAKDARVGIMQRLHERDLTGHLLAKNAGYVHLMLPSEFDPKRRSVTVVHGRERWRDPRTKPGELLFPQLHTRAWLDEQKRDLGPWQYAAQHQQLPLPSTGGIFQKAWFIGGEAETPEGKKQYPDRSYTRRQLPPVFNETIQSWDFAFKKKSDSDFVVGQVWSRLGADVYLRFERRGRMGFGESKQAIRDTSDAWKETHTKLVEDKANGPAIIEELKNDVPGLIALANNDGVEAHAWAIQGYVEAGNIHVPHASEWPEVEEWLAEVCGYPRAAHDDRVAAFTQAVLRLMRNARGQMAPASKTPEISETAKAVNTVVPSSPMPKRF